jgi:aryl-alcohol dehydrogenase-like predicted oxidoreductase
VAVAQGDFGRTGHRSSRTIFGAASLSRVTQAAADRTLEVLLRYGVNHIDTAASYGDSELRIAPWLAREPGRFDHVDLWQLHNLADPIEWDTALSPGGVIEAAMEARDQGLVKWIGVTGHGAQIAANHRRSLDRFDFDSVLLPYNFVTMELPYYAENFEALARTCAERKVAVQTIKSIAAKPWLGREPSRTTWYQPLEAQSDIDLAVWWVLGRPGVFLNTVGDIDLLPRVLDAAERFEKRPTDSEMNSLLERSQTAPLFV